MTNRQSCIGGDDFSKSTIPVNSLATVRTRLTISDFIKYIYCISIVNLSHRPPIDVVFTIIILFVLNIWSSEDI
jgi:hypothetical protein